MRQSNKSLHTTRPSGPAFAWCSHGAANAGPAVRAGELNRYGHLKYSFIPRLFVCLAMISIFLSQGCSHSNSKPQDSASSAKEAQDQFNAILDSKGPLDGNALFKTLPIGWSISVPAKVPAPYGMIGNGKEGVMVHLTGKEYIESIPNNKHNKGPESITIWAMPYDYKVVEYTATQHSAQLL